MAPISGSAGGGGPSSAASSNESGWNVNFGSGGLNAGPSSELSQYLPFVVLAVGALVAISYFRKRK